MIENLRKKLAVAILAMISVILIGVLVPIKVFAADNGIPEGYTPDLYNYVPHAQFRNVFESETVEISGIRVLVKEETDDGSGNVVRTDPEDAIHFRIFNTTTQEDFEVDTEIHDDGHSYLPAMQLKKGHDYIFSVEDRYYCNAKSSRYPSESKTYVQILAGDEDQASKTGEPGAYDYMTDSIWYSKVNEIDVERRETECIDPFDDNRFDSERMNQPIYVYYKGKAKAGVKFRLVSDREEPIEAVTDYRGILHLRLIEGVTYMVYTDSDIYDIDPFPIVAKDKGEYKEGFFACNHTNCMMVSGKEHPIVLYDKGKIEADWGERKTTVRSLMGRTSVSGINFRNQLIIDRQLDEKIDQLGESDHEVFDVTAINPRRWEISKLSGTDFTIRHTIPAGKSVAHVYQSDNGVLTELDFRQFVERGTNKVEFVSDGLSIYKYVIEYGKADLSDAACSVSDVVYSGNEKKPSVNISLWGAALVNGTDYSAVYSNNINVGKATVTLTGSGAYTGERSVCFKINPKGTTLSKLKAGKRRAKVTWKKQAEQVSGYQIQYSTSKTFKKGVKQVTVKRTTKTKATIKKLRAKKKYYFRIRTYKTTGKDTYYSNWSKVRRIRVK